MNIGGQFIDHIEIYDNTGEIIGFINDEKVECKMNMDLRFCKDSIMFNGQTAKMQQWEENK